MFSERRDTGRYLQLYAAIKVKMESLIRQAYKAALGLPHYTSTEKFLQLGVQNTLDALCETRITTHMMTLTKTEAGRNILAQLDTIADPEIDESGDLPTKRKKELTIKQLPKSMHPAHQEGMRTPRALALHHKY